MTQHGVGRIGFIGLGRMGTPMASRLVESGYELTVRDTDPAVMRTFLTAHPGTRAAASPPDWADVDVLILMLPNSAIVEAVLETDGVAGALSTGALVLDMSSSEPLRTRQLAGRLARSGLRFADAPVSGGVRGAAAGTLATLFGGSALDLDIVRPLLNRLARTIIHVGPVGCGHAAKALNNLVSATTVSATVEALRVAERFGIPPSTMTAVLNGSSGRTNTSQNKVEQFMLSGTFDSGFSLALMAKDVRIAADLARELDWPLEIGEAIAAQWRRIAATAEPATDHTAMYALVEKEADR
jgi:3-hydroxyisobutyrate dehydrogenase